MITEDNCLSTTSVVIKLFHDENDGQHLCVTALNFRQRSTCVGNWMSVLHQGRTKTTSAAVALHFRLFTRLVVG